MADQEEKRYRIVRCSGDFFSAVVIWSSDAELYDPEAKFYSYNWFWKGKGRLREIDRERIFSYFSGISDGMGFGEIPQKTETFSALDEVREWLEKKANEAGRKRLIEQGIDPDSDDPVLPYKELIDLLYRGLRAGEIVEHDLFGVITGSCPLIKKGKTGNAVEFKADTRAGKIILSHIALAILRGNPKILCEKDIDWCMMNGSRVVNSFKLFIPIHPPETTKKSWWRK